MASPLLLVLVLATMAGAAWCLVRWWPTAGAMATTGSGRFASLDGLRGLLACSVLVHHGYIARACFNGRPWETPGEPLYRFAGDAAVSVFFMITGLLFWSKVLSGRLRWGDLMIKRIRRIAPLQLFALMVISVICLSRPASGSAGDIAADVRGMMSWLGQGFLGSARINGVPTLQIDAGVTWSLTLEWCFYLVLLPMGVLFAKPSRFVGLLALSVVSFVILRRTGHFVAQAKLLMLMPFLVGMSTAYLVLGGSRSEAARTPVCSIAVVLTVLCVVAGYARGNPQMLNLALTPAFVLIVLGNDLFGLLSRPWLRWLGHISFSVYLLHGIVMLSVLRWVDASTPLARFDDLSYAALLAAIGLLTVLMASATYLWIERSFFDPLPAPRWMARLRRSAVA